MPQGAYEGYVALTTNYEFCSACLAIGWVCALAVTHNDTIVVRLASRLAPAKKVVKLEVGKMVVVANFRQ